MNRIEMKTNARERIRENRGMAILGMLLPMIVVGAIIGILGGGIALSESPAFVPIIFIVVIALIPINIGIFYFYRKLSNTGDASLEDLLKGHKENFAGNLGNLILMQIFINLWMLLFIVPGIIKTFSYMMTPFILGDDDIKRGADQPSPITLSRVMMDGHKKELFILILSFIGWFILGAITLNILTIIFVGPYFQLTMANFYEKVKGNLDEKYLKNA